jgi:hypothetical protein
MISKGRAWGGVALVTVMLSPPLVLGYFQWNWVAAHGVWTAIAAVGYEAFILAIGFIGQVWGQLRIKWAKSLSERIDLAAGRRFSRFEQHYLNYIQQTHRFIDQKGLATLGERTPELDDVFVDVSLASRCPQHVSGAILSEPPSNITERRSIWDFLTEEMSAPAVLAIIGAPGSGKTTLLRHAAARLCRISRHRGLPVLLMLRESAALITSQPDIELSVVIGDQINGLLKPAPTGWFDQRLASGRCVVMFDGLDEVALQEHRQCVVDWVDRQIARYPNNDYMITSRPHGYQEYPLERAVVLQVRRFTPSQISRFVHGWYLAVERHSTGATGEFVEKKAADEADDLLARLSSVPALADLASNPLLLTMIANVHRYRGALPGTRAELYAEMCVVLLGRRQQAKKLAEQLRIDQKEVVLRELAFTMMKERVRDLANQRVSDLIGSVLPRVSSSVGPREFLADIRANGILLEREHGVYCFAHHTFQEYLAAVHIRERGQLDVLANNVGDPWWREVTLLFVVRGAADPVVEACLASGRISALTLAFDCADSASELTPELRRRLDALLSEASDPFAPAERRKLAAAAIASRQLRSSIAMENGAQVCAAPVSRSLYQLYLSHMQVEQDESVSLGLESRVLDTTAFVGRVANPYAFVEWLNVLLEADVIYRLPTRAEITDSAISGNIAFREFCFWFTPNEESSQLDIRVPSGIVNPYIITDRDLRGQAYADAVGVIGIMAACYFALALVHVIAFSQALSLRCHTNSESSELNKALSLVLDFSHKIAQNLVLDLKMNLNLDIAEIRNLNRTRAESLPSDGGDENRLTSLLVISFALHRTLDRLLDLDLDLAPSPGLDIRNARSRGTVLDSARHRAPALCRALEKTRKCALGFGLGQALEPGRDLDIILDRTLDHSRRLDIPFELDRCLNEIARIPLSIAHDQDVDLNVDVDLSRWMLIAQSSLLLGKPRITDKIEWLASPNSSMPASGQRTVLPFRLKSQSSTGLDELRIARYAADGDPFRDQKIVGIAFGLDELVRAVVDHGMELSPHLASYMRLMALAIAQKADEFVTGRELAQRFVDIAAGIMALERQERDASYANEAIVLMRN